MSKKARRKEIQSEIKPDPKPENKKGNQKDNTYIHFLYLIIITLLFLAVYGYIFDKKLDLNGDNAYYYVLGKALSEGEGYVNIANINKIPNNHYPPGYPFILSIFMHLSDSLVFLKIINGVFLLASLFMFYYLFNYYSRNPNIAFVAVILLLLNAHLLLYGTMIMSELSFIVVSFLCLIFIQKTDFKQNTYKKPYIYLVLLTLVGTYYIRSTGLALFGGLILFLLIKKHWKPALFIAAGFIALAMPWILRGQKLGGSAYLKPLVMINPYRAELGNADLADYFNRFFSNVSRYITREIPSSTLPFINVNYREDIQIMEWGIGLIILSFILYGLYKLGTKSLIIICYLIGTFGILLFWPEVWTGVRFVLPVVPLLLFAAIYGVYEGVQYVLLKSKFKFKINILVLLLFGLSFTAPIKRIHLKAKNDYPIAWKNYFNVAGWFKKEGINDAVIICRKPMLFHLKSGTYTSTFKYSNDDQDLLNDLEKREAQYVVLDNLGYRQTYEYLLPAINNNKERFQVVFKLDNPDTYLLKFYPAN
jgi:hypothetical protein